MLRLWIGRALLWLLLPAQIERAQRRAATPMGRGGWRMEFRPVISETYGDGGRGRGEA